MLLKNYWGGEGGQLPPLPPASYSRGKGTEKSFFISQMSHESSYEAVSGFSPKVRLRVKIRVMVSVRITGVFLSG